MEKQPTLAYVTVTVIASVLAVVGVYLPWVQKRPVEYIVGYHEYTAEYVPGLEPGIGIWGIDPFIIILVGVVVTRLGAIPKLATGECSYRCWLSAHHRVW